MVGRPKIFNEQEAVDRATEVFKDKGYDTASADELLGAMGIGKGSFYLAFKGGKQELYARSIKQFSENFHHKLVDQIAKTDNQIDFIKQLFLGLANGSGCDKERGCYLGNALVQLSDKDEDIKKISGELLRKLHQVFAKAIQKAQESGQIKSTVDSEILAWHLTNLWNGIHITKRMESSPKILTSIIELNLKVLD